MFLHIVQVEYLTGYKLRIAFDNKTIKEVDLSNELYGEIFEPLKDLDKFRKVRVNPETNTIEWKNGADFSPEFLFEIGKTVTIAA